ncbi:TetR family transcriptional regulator C-terminal domain-containing protein [Streptomyces sp. NPDC001307]|uniref:TetR family transcriptional regulator C-terminal domain-containing protein n=1 Tax=Streptomyces sp. NPDC001307 TaxID=3364560 RepID=UPI00369C102C
MEALRAWQDFAVNLERSLGYARGCPIGTLGSQPAETDPDARKDIAAGFALWEKSIVEGLQAMRDRGELRSDADARPRGLALSTTLQGGLLLTRIRRDTWALEVALDAMLDHVESFLVPV